MGSGADHDVVDVGADFPKVFEEKRAEKVILGEKEEEE